LPKIGAFRSFDAARLAQKSGTAGPPTGNNKGKGPATSATRENEALRGPEGGDCGEAGSVMRYETLKKPERQGMPAAGRMGHNRARNNKRNQQETGGKERELGTCKTRSDRSAQGRSHLLEDVLTE